MGRRRTVSGPALAEILASMSRPRPPTRLSKPQLRERQAAEKWHLEGEKCRARMASAL